MSFGRMQTLVALAGLFFLVLNGGTSHPTKDMGMDQVTINHICHIKDP